MSSTLYPVRGPSRRGFGWQHLACPAEGCQRPGATPIMRHYPARYSASWRATDAHAAESVFECSCGATWLPSDRHDPADGTYPTKL